MPLTPTTAPGFIVQVIFTHPLPLTAQDTVEVRRLFLRSVALEYLDLSRKRIWSKTKAPTRIYNPTV